MISRVYIKGYKSLEEIEVELHPLTVVFGPNAAGKSNLFDALGLLSRMVTAETLNKAFVGHRGLPLEAFHWGKDGLDGLLARDTAQFTIEVDVKLSAETVETVERQIRQMRKGLPGGDGRREAGKRWVVERDLRYTLTVEIVTASGHLRVVNEKLVALTRDGEPKRNRKSFLGRVKDTESGTLYLRLRMEGQARPPTDYEIGLDYTMVSRPLYPPHYPHITAFKEEVSRWRFYYLEPREMMRADSPLKDIDSIGPHGEDLAAFFNALKANNPKEFDGISHALRHILPGLQGIDVERTREGLLQLKVLEGGAPFPARVISEGTLRVLGLLAIANPRRPATVIGYEEPENGVHPRRLKIIADLLKNAALRGDTQVLINTHSPLLPEYFGDESLIVCRKEGFTTTFDPFTSVGAISRRGAIKAALEETPLSTRIARGDFGG
jgi:predicted ATPase